MTCGLPVATAEKLVGDVVAGAMMLVVVRYMRSNRLSSGGGESRDRYIRQAAA